MARLFCVLWILSVEVTTQPAGLAALVVPIVFTTYYTAAVVVVVVESDESPVWPNPSFLTTEDKQT